MSLHSQSKSCVLFNAIVVICLAICLIMTISVGTASARSVKKQPPRPFVLNRGDGDTINGKIIINDYYGDHLLNPDGPLSANAVGEGKACNECHNWMKPIKWAFLYRLIK